MPACRCCTHPSACAPCFQPCGKPVERSERGHIIGHACRHDEVGGRSGCRRSCLPLLRCRTRSAARVNVQASALAVANVPVAAPTMRASASSSAPRGPPSASSLNPDRREGRPRCRRVARLVPCGLGSALSPIRSIVRLPPHPGAQATTRLSKPVDLRDDEQAPRPDPGSAARPRPSLLALVAAHRVRPAHAPARASTHRVACRSQSRSLPS